MFSHFGDQRFGRLNSLEPARLGDVSLSSHAEKLARPPSARSTGIAQCSTFFAEAKPCAGGVWFLVRRTKLGGMLNQPSSSQRAKTKRAGRQGARRNDPC